MCNININRSFYKSFETPTHCLGQCPKQTILWKNFPKHNFPLWSVKHSPINCVCLAPRRRKRGSGQSSKWGQSQGTRSWQVCFSKHQSSQWRRTLALQNMISKSWSRPVLVGEAPWPSLVDLVVAERGGGGRRGVCLCGNYSRSTWYLWRDNIDSIENTSWLDVDPLDIHWIYPYVTSKPEFGFVS